MTYTVTCDWCKKTAPTEGLVRWWQLDEIGIDLRRLGQRGDPYHFCSSTCLVQGVTKINREDEQ